MKIPIESSTSYRGRNSRPNWLALILFIVLAFAAGAGGAVFTPGTSAATATWYQALVKPAWTPPNTWFAPIWITLYFLMGSAAWLVWRERYHRARNTALLAYAIQLMVNAAWSPLFFGNKNIGAGLFVIVALWLAVAWAIREFARVRPVAACLLVPYLLWVTVAAALNLSIWRHNP